MDISITEAVELSADELKSIPYKGHLGTRYDRKEFHRVVVTPVEYCIGTLFYRYDTAKREWVPNGTRLFARRIKKDGTPYSEALRDLVFDTDDRVKDLIEKHKPTSVITIRVR